jgi:23S rRNA (uracil1939-C5)-methyltransferase
VARKKKFPLLEDVEITDIGSEGKAVARVNDKVLFIPLLLPGDIVNVQVTRKKKKYLEGRVESFVKYSELRIKPFCKHFGTCGGCKWQHLPYDKQLFYKQKQVKDNLERLSHVQIPHIQKIIPSESNKEYRNKLEFSFSSKRWITEHEINKDIAIDDSRGFGFHVPGYFDKVVNIDECYLQGQISENIRKFVKDYTFSNNYSFHDLRTHEGLMRNLIVRTATTNEVMVIFSFFYNDKEKIELLLSSVKSNFPEITSIMYIINEKLNDSISDQEVILYSGKSYIVEEMGKLQFKIGPKSFYQTNSRQAHVLYNVALEFADLKGSETVYDLYTGTGTIANYISRYTSKVIGIEYVEEAVDDAIFNSSLNGISNTEFFSGDMKDVLTDAFIQEHGTPEVIITDPPRAGMHKDVIEVILNANPQRIVYVSCNPSTQARDIDLLGEKYVVQKVQPVDMFPHTHHVENVILLKRK